jgi:hypothetical protein
MLVEMMSCAPIGIIIIADEQYIHRSRVVMRYLPITCLNQTIYAADTQAEQNISELPKSVDCLCVSKLLVTIIAIAPPIPSSKPAIFIFVNRSKPATTDSKSTSNGVMVLMMEPSIGDVLAKPNIIHNFLPIPISIAAPNILRRSFGSTLSYFSHNRGVSESSAAMANDADTIVSGDMYRPRIRL